MLEKKRSLPFPFFSNKNDLSEFALCAICDVAMSVILTERGFDMTKVQIEAQLQYFCSSFLGIEDDRVCEGIIDVNAVSIVYRQTLETNTVHTDSKKTFDTIF